jgi:hypothetical protein
VGVPELQRILALRASGELVGGESIMADTDGTKAARCPVIEPDRIEAVFKEMAARGLVTGCRRGYAAAPCSPAIRPEFWCNECLMRVAAEAWAEREREHASLLKYGGN